MVVVWQSTDASSIRAQILAADGAPVGPEFAVNSQTNPEVRPTAAGLVNGGFVVIWQDFSGTLGDASGSSIKAQLFTTDGSKDGPEFLVNTQTSGFQQLPTVTSLNNGGFVVTWQDLSGSLGDASGNSIKAQLFAPGGSKVGSEFLVNTQTLSSQSVPTTTGLANGGFVITWQDTSGTLGDASGSSIKVQVFSASGAKVGSETLVDANTAGNQTVPTITGLANGGFVITWQDTSGTLGDDSGSSIKAQLFTADGAKVGSEFLVNSQTIVNDQVTPAVTALSNGDFIVAWQNAGDIRARVFAADGSDLGDEFAVDAETGSQPKITALGNGGFAIVWQDAGAEPGDVSIRAQIYALDSTPPDAPTITNTSAVGGYVNAARDTETQSLSGAAEAYTTIRVYLNGSPTPSFTTTADGNGIWSVNVGRLADGGYSYTATATDVAGNVSASSSALNFVVDTITSFPEITSIASEGSHTVALSGTIDFVDAPHEITIVDGRFLFGSNPAAWSATTVADTTGHWGITGVPWSVFANSVAVIASDGAGNMGLSHYVYTGSWAVNGATLGSGDRQFVYGLSSGWVIASGALQTVYAGGLADGAVIRGTQVDWGDAINTVIDGGTQVVWGSASATTISQGIQYVGGTAYGTTIGGDSHQTIYGGGRASGTAVHGGSQFVWGAADLTTVDNGGLQEVHGSATSTMIVSGRQTVHGGATVIGTTLNAGSTQYNWGAAVATTINLGGTQYVYGSATGTMINGGTQYIANGATASDTTIEEGGRLRIDGSGAINNVIFGQPGGTLELWSSTSSGPISGFASGDRIYVLDMPVTHFVYAPNADNSGGTLQVFSSAIGFNNKVASLELLGQYAAGDFLVAHDVSSGQAYVTTTHVDAIPLVTPSQS